MLAIAVDQSLFMLTDTTQSRACSLLQGFLVAEFTVCQSIQRSEFNTNPFHASNHGACVQGLVHLY